MRPDLDPITRVLVTSYEILMIVFAIAAILVILMGLAWLLLFAMQSWPNYRTEFGRALSSLRGGVGIHPRSNLVPLKDRSTDRVGKP
jgi:hypothetical protein